jgi:putative ABC transport system permease protein
MLSHYLKIAVRNLLQQKFYALINILGLAIGLASWLLITMYVMNQLSYDRFHERADRIYRVNYSAKLVTDGDRYTIGATPPPVARILSTEFPEIERGTRIYPKGSSVIRYGDKYFTEGGVLAVDSNFFQVFSFKLKQGDPITALQEPNSLIVTEDMARKYFGNEPAFGKTLLMGDSRTPYKVVGIVENPPPNSHFTFNILTSIASEEQVRYFDWSWIWSGLITYVQLKEGAPYQALDAKFPALVKRHAGYTIGRIFDSSLEDFEKNGNGIRLFLQPLTDIYLRSAGIDGGLGTQSDIRDLYIFSAIAFFILLLACINFMNLSTARSAGRSKEVGVRKVLGSVKSQLIVQFLTESLLTSLIAMLLAFGLCELFLLLFKNSLWEGLGGSLLGQDWLWLVAVALVFVVGIVAGSYPAFFLSAFKPVEVLKGKLKLGMKSGVIRSTLVVFQFTVSICLIICTTLVFKQLHYMREQDLGFKKENVIIISNTDRLGTNGAAFKQTLLGMPQVLSASFSTGLPAGSIDGELFTPEGSSNANNLLSFMTADYDYLKTLGITLTKGRSFSPDFPSDTTDGAEAILINESAVKALGWENPIGKHLFSSRGSGKPQEIIGVYRDFNYRSLHEKIQPLLIVCHPEGDYLSVRVRPGGLPQTLKTMEQEWRKLAVQTPFEYSFLDENFDSQYRGEQQTARLFTFFTGLAIFIACLGLFGLATFTAEQRTKEIGIRKVLGASVWSVVNLLSKDFLKLVLLANLIAWPLAWYLIGEWLKDFAYRTPVGPWTFVLAGLLAASIALLTVFFQAFKVAQSNPVQSLRAE